MLLVGYGVMGQNHARALSSLPEVEVHVFDPVASLDHLPMGCFALRSFPESLEQFDGVVVASSTATHSGYLQRIAPELPLLIEKPLVNNLAELTALEPHREKTFVGFSERFNPAASLASMTLKSSRVIFFEAERLGGAPRQASGLDPVTDLAVHDLDTICHGLDAFNFKGQIVDIRDDEGEVVRSTVFGSFEGGMVFEVRASYLAMSKLRRHSLRMTNEMRIFDAIGQSLEIQQISSSKLASESWPSMEYMRGGVRVKSTKEHLESAEPIREQAKAFLDFCRGGIPDTRLATYGQSLQLLYSLFSLERVGINA